MSKMPSLFIGHGSPMNAIAHNAYSQTLNTLGKALPIPKAILCVSAHWFGEGLKITEMEQPATIHDFYGFPEELFAVQYPAPGAPKMAESIRQQFPDLRIQPDFEWGLDHGTWSVLKHLYPEANIPVMQLSIEIKKDSAYQFAVGQKISSLREQGILILGSGNIVHNLRTINFSPTAPAFPWAEEFNVWVQKNLDSKNYSNIVNHSHDSHFGKLSIPTQEHWYPFLTILGTARPQDKMSIVYDGIENSSISMKSVMFTPQ